MKVLFLDIETAPNTAHVWGLFDQQISVNQIMESSYTLCWAAKWRGKGHPVMFESVQKQQPRHMLGKMHTLLEEADMVVHYHGTKFDMPTLNKEFLIYGFTPPASVKELDLLRIVKKHFKFPSNKLGYVTERLKLGKKVDHEGHDLWVKCMANDAKAWAQMERYNKGDVVLLEKLYEKILPWIKHRATIPVRLK